MAKIILSSMLLVAVIAVVMIGCAQNEPYHTLAWEEGNCTSSPGDEKCLASYYQQYPKFDLAFAEYSERGNAFNDKYLSDVLARISAYANDKGAVVITFIHGWKHNAREDDTNLLDFKESLAAIAESGSVGDRKLIGLYVGWRGVSVDVAGLNNVTFWDRKAVAEVVGNGGVTRFLLELDRIDSGQDQNVFVVVGHSFGGAIVVSALTEVLTARIVKRTKVRNFGNSIGDAVIVLNPAIEANQALHLVEAAIKEDFPDAQHPMFVSISSDADRATHQAFPLGQTVGTLLTWRQADLQRHHMHDRLNAGRPVLLREEHLDSTTVGNFAPFLTHRLTVKGSDEAPEFVFQTCDEVPTQCEPKGLTRLSGQPTIKDLPNNYPLFFIKTDKSVMSGHNDIFNNKIKAFLLTVINDVVRRNLIAFDVRATKSTPSILAEKDRLETESEQFYGTLRELDR